MPFVLDASVTISWCFADEQTDQSQRALELLSDSYALVPALWLIEITNVLFNGERRRRVTAPGSLEFLADLALLDIRVQSDSTWPAGLPDRILRLCRRHGLTAYDATYLDLAKQSALPLATLDKEVIEAAPLEGVALLLQPA